MSTYASVATRAPMSLPVVHLPVCQRICPISNLDSAKNWNYCSLTTCAHKTWETATVSGAFEVGLCLGMFGGSLMPCNFGSIRTPPGFRRLILPNHTNLRHTLRYADHTPMHTLKCADHTHATLASAHLFDAMR